MTQRYAHLLDESRTNSEKIISYGDHNLSNETEEENYVSETVNAELLSEEVQETDFPVEDQDTENSEEEPLKDFIRETTYAEPLEKESPVTDITEEQELTDFVQVTEQEVGLHENVFSKAHEAEQEEDYSQEYTEKVIEIVAEEESIISEVESKETVEEVENYFQSSNESTENIVKVSEKERQEYIHVPTTFKEKSSHSYNAFTEFFKQTEALKTQQEDNMANPSTPAEELGLNGNVATDQKVEELNENLIDVLAADGDGEATEANNESEKKSNEPNHDEVTVMSSLEDVSVLNVEELEDVLVDNKADEPANSAGESTNQSEVMSPEAVEEENVILNTQSMPIPIKCKKEVIVFQSFKKRLPVFSKMDDGVNASDIKNVKDVENKTQPKVRPSIKELKKDLRLLSKLIKAAPRREKKKTDLKRCQF